MIRTLVVASFLTLLAVLGGACGGGSDSEESSAFVPRPIPSEYVGLSMEELKAKETGASYDDILSDIEDYEGKLVWFDGEINQIHEGSVKDTYQIWLCAGGGARGRVCDQPVMLLYSFDRGPELSDGDRVQAAGIMVGTTKRAVNLGAGVSSGGRTLVTTPMVSVIKAELVTESD